MENKKIFYSQSGWLFDRHMELNESERDENRSIEVDEETYWKTMSSPLHFAWKVINGELVNVRYQETPTSEIVEDIRIRRQNECFYFTDRAGWLYSLTQAQHDEVMIWRQQWLNAPATLQVPPKPSWLL